MQREGPVTGGRGGGDREKNKRNKQRNGGTCGEGKRDCRKATGGTSKREGEEEERRIYLYPFSLPIPQDQLKEYEETLEGVKGEIEEEQKQLRLLNEQLVDLNHEKSQYTAKVKENRQKIKHFENEVIENVLHLQ